jgi:hypothetical protein
VAQRSTEGVVDPLCTGVCRSFALKVRQRSGEGLGSVVFQREGVIQPADHPSDDLALAKRS